MLIIHALFIFNLFMYAIIAFSVIDYLIPRKSKIASFGGCTAALYILNIPLIFLREGFLGTGFLGMQAITITALFLIVYFLALHINFKDSLLKKLFVTFLILIILVINEIITIFMFWYFKIPLVEIETLFSPLDSSWIISAILNNTTLLIIYTTVFRILGRKNNTYEIQNKFVLIIFLSVQLFYSIFLFNIFYIYKETLSFTLHIVVIIIPVVSIVLFIYSLYSKNMNYKLKLKSEYTELLIAAQSKHIAEIVEQNSQITRLKHDFGTHAKVLSDLAQTQKYDELIKYVQEFKEDYTLKPLYFCSRGAVNAILSGKYNLAKEKDIDIQIFFDDNGSESVSDIDLCSIISNLMQNAIEACERIANPDVKRFIKLSASAKADCFIIAQTNSGLQPNQGLKTSKSDPKNHGAGLNIIKDMAKKYNGSANFEFADGIFESMVILGK